MDMNRVYPRLKGLFNDEFPDPLGASKGQEFSLEGEDALVYKDFAPGLGVFYALDEGSMFTYVQFKHLPEGMNVDVLHETAVLNMAKAFSEDIKMYGVEGDVLMLTNGGDFEATLMLLDELWPQMESHFEDSVCVAVPAKDLIFISATHQEEGREVLRKLVRRYFNEQETPGLLVRHIYELKDGRWNLVETV